MDQLQQIGALCLDECAAELYTSYRQQNPNIAVQLFKAILALCSEVKADTEITVQIGMLVRYGAVALSDETLAMNSILAMMIQ